MIDQVKIGSFLKELRKEKELTQEQLAEKFGVSSRSVSRWENGNTRPEYVEIGHNGIREKYKRQGYGHLQLKEALRRI